MYFEYLANPLNRRKKKYKYYLRKFEDFIKQILIYFIILPLSLPILLKNYFFSYNYLFKDFVNQNGSVFIVFTFLEMKKSKFSIRNTLYVSTHHSHIIESHYYALFAFPSRSEVPYFSHKLNVKYHLYSFLELHSCFILISYKIINLRQICGNSTFEGTLVPFK